MAALPVCTICSDPQRRAAVDGFLRAGIALREISKNLGLSKSAVHRHSLHSEARQNATAGALGHDLRSRRAWTRLLRRAEKKGDLAAATKAQAEIDKLDRIRAAQKQAKTEATTPDWTAGVRAALGFLPTVPGFKSNTERDAELSEALKSACERHADDEAFLASAARLLSKLTGRALPESLEVEVARIEGGSDGPTRLDSRNEAGNGEGGNRAATGRDTESKVERSAAGTGNTGGALPEVRRGDASCRSDPSHV